MEVTFERLEHGHISLDMFILYLFSLLVFVVFWFLFLFVVVVFSIVSGILGSSVL